MKIFLNNKQYAFSNKSIKNSSSWNILNLCNVLQIHIPVFCYHEKLNVAGNCRMCLVEVEKSPKPVVSCANPVTNMIRVYTETPLVKKARENILEMLLINHPLDCPICDQGGECDLQDNVKDFSIDRNRNFNFMRRQVENKNLGVFVQTIMTRCIHCTRCVRFIAEWTNDKSLWVLGRGRSMEIGSYIENFVKTEFSANIIDLCPVGALTSKMYSFRGRPWELTKTKTIDLSDAWGNSIWVYNKGVSHTLNFKKKQANSHEHDQILRILPYSINNTNDNWISDKTRFSFDGLYINRLKTFKCFGFNNTKQLKKSLFLKNQIDIFKFLNTHQTQFTINFHQIQANFIRWVQLN